MNFFSLQFLLCSLIPLSFALYIYISHNREPSGDTPFTGPKTHPLLGILPEFIKNRHRFLEWLTEVIAASPTQTMVFCSPGHANGVITANPQNIEYMLKTNFDNYPQGKRKHAMMEDFLGHGIFNSDGEHWRVQRKMASFEFNQRSLRNFVVENVRFEITQRLLPLLTRATEEGEVLDLQEALERFAFDNICKVAFGVDPGSLAGEEGTEQSTPPSLMRDFDDAGRCTVERFLDAVANTWKVKRFLNIGSERRLRESIKVVHDFAMKTIRSRKENPAHRSDDLLSRFAAYEGSSEEFLRDIVVSFMVAGRETTSSSLTWFFWLLSSKPEVEKRVLEEVRSIRARNPDSTDTFDFEELRGMHYLHAAITEALRLYPPVPLDTQSCRDDDVFPDGTVVGKGWVVTYSAYSMGRLESIWGKDCCEFKPERWLLNGVFQAESPFKFPVFHAGPRMCLGKEMAYIQMKAIAASILEEFQLEIEEKDKPPEYVLAMTMKMKGGLRIRVKRRGKVA